MFEPTLITFLIVCPLALLAGFVDAIAGGGGLISIPAYLFAGVPVHTAIGTNKLSSAMGTTATVWRFIKHGYMVKELVVVGVICGLVGSFIGSNLTLMASETLIKVLMLVALPPIAFYVLRTKNLDAHNGNDFPLKRTMLFTAGIALVIGAYDGFYGPGTGTFLILLLTGVAHMGLKEANGTTKAINLATNVASLVVFAVNGVVLLPLGLAAGAFNIVGNLLGSHLFHGKGSTITRPIICVVIVLFAVKLISELA